MSHTPCDYSTRTGIFPVSWDDFHGLCRALALAIAPYSPEIILPVGRGGYYPGVLLAHMLQVEVYPVCLSRRVNDVVQYEIPRWLQDPPAVVRECRVLIVDEISSTGETLRMVREKAVALGATAVRSAVLYAHTWGVEEPDYIGLISDALLMNPWDREVLRNNAFEFHPEYAAAMAQQGLSPEPSLLISATPFTLAKHRQ